MLWKTSKKYKIQTKINQTWQDKRDRKETKINNQYGCFLIQKASTVGSSTWLVWQIVTPDAPSDTTPKSFVSSWSSTGELLLLVGKYLNHCTITISKWEMIFFLKRMIKNETTSNQMCQDVFLKTDFKEVTSYRSPRAGPSPGALLTLSEFSTLPKYLSTFLFLKYFPPVAPSFLLFYFSLSLSLCFPGRPLPFSLKTVMMF